MDVPRLYFDLGRKFPRAWTSPINGTSGDPQPYFEGNHIVNIDSQESVEFALTISDTDQQCEFVISVVYEHQGSRYRQDVAQPSQGLPFRLTPSSAKFASEFDVGVDTLAGN